MSITDRWAERRNVATWSPDDYRITREQIGHTVYRVTIHDGIRIVSSRDFQDGAEAQAYWLDVQAAHIDSMRELLPPPLPNRPERIVEILEGDLGEYPPLVTR